MAKWLWKRELLTGPDMKRVIVPVPAPVRDWVVHAAEHTTDSLKKFPKKSLFPGFSPGQSLSGLRAGNLVEICARSLEVARDLSQTPNTYEITKASKTKKPASSTEIFSRNS